MEMVEWGITNFYFSTIMYALTTDGFQIENYYILSEYWLGCDLSGSVQEISPR